MGLFRKKGISLLIPTQNVEQTVELCIRSHAGFGDEMIVVDNGSTDNTIDIVRSLEDEIPNMTFYEAPHLKDLYENRQYAFERSQYEWIARIDSDFIAYNEGPNDIKNLRDLILKTKKGIRPKAFGISFINLFGDFHHMGIPKEIINKNLSFHITPPFSSAVYRIIQWHPGMRFQRNGRWEGIRWQGSRLFKHMIIKKPFWFHCTLKTKKELFIRYERNNWRELGDFVRFPTRNHYIEYILNEKYNGINLEDAASKHWLENIRPYLLPYNPSIYYPYPSKIKEIVDAEEIYKNA